MPQQGMTDLSRLRKRPLETAAGTSARAAGEIDIAGVNLTNGGHVATAAVDPQQTSGRCSTSGSRSRKGHIEKEIRVF
jgi:predicted ribonuclease toxin of YeeF-YezG toxin-antitoxin module